MSDERWKDFLTEFVELLVQEKATIHEYKLIGFGLATMAALEIDQAPHKLADELRGFASHRRTLKRLDTSREREEARRARRLLIKEGKIKHDNVNDNP